MKRFKVLGGDHSEDGTTYAKGEVVTTERPLDKMFMNKFERLRKGKKDKKKKKAETKAKVKLSLSSVPPASSDTPARGKDVTAEFEGVQKEGLHVFKRGSWYHVYDGESTTPLNEKALKKGGVEEFVTAHLEE